MVIMFELNFHFVGWNFIYIFILLIQSSVSLMFPQPAPARIQWLKVGFGIPVQDLNIESMVTGYVLKAKYFQRYNLTHLKPKSGMPFVSRKFGNHLKLDNFLDAPENLPPESIGEFLENNKQALVSSYRWTVYKGLEGLADRMGLPGRECVLKSICEAAETPFHYFNGLFGELLHIFLTPSSSADKLSSHSDNEYYYAEQMGRSRAKCKAVFNLCSRSLLDNFSDIHHLSH